MANRFEKLPEAPLDQIMIANAGWQTYAAKHPDAVNTTIGVLIDPMSSRPWQPPSVQAARQAALADVLDKSAFGYQNQAGYLNFLTATGEQVFGQGLYSDTDILGYQALGGTGALSLARDTLAALVGKDADGRIPMVLDAGWPNHPAIFNEPFSIATYFHQDPKTGAYNHQGALDTFGKAPKNSVFLMQTCGYNDDGMDRTPQQWDEILQIAKDKEAIVVLDSAYAGLVHGFERDRYPIEQSVQQELLTFVCFSASKNMGLYNERLGAVFIANATSNLGAEQSKRLDQLAKGNIRRTYSNPPMVTAKAAAVALRGEAYQQELQAARAGLQTNREVFGELLRDRLPAIAVGGGLFTKILPGGFSTEQQTVLADAGIYALPNSRINLGGIHPDHVERVGLAVLQALNTRIR